MDPTVSSEQNLSKPAIAPERLNPLNESAAQRNLGHASGWFHFIQPSCRDQPFIHSGSAAILWKFFTRMLPTSPS
jgi:hypothetical protein